MTFTNLFGILEINRFVYEFLLFLLLDVSWSENSGVERQENGPLGLVPFNNHLFRLLEAEMIFVGDRSPLQGEEGLILYNIYTNKKRCCNNSIKIFLTQSMSVM